MNLKEFSENLEIDAKENKVFNDSYSVKLKKLRSKNKTGVIFFGNV